MGKITMCPKTSILFKLVGFSVWNLQFLYRASFIISFFLGGSVPIFMFLKDLNSCKLNVNQENISPSSLFCLWAHEFSNRTMLSWVLNYTDSCILELPCSWYIHTTILLGWFFACVMTPMVSSKKYRLISESAHQILRQIAMDQSTLPAEEISCSFWFLWILEHVFFMDFLISCYKSSVNL